MNYQRYGSALAVLVLLESFLPPAGRELSDSCGAFSNGLACGVALFVKISCGIACIAIAAVALLLAPRRLRRAAALAAGLATAVLPVLLWLHFDLNALAREYRFLAAARASTLTPAFLVKLFYENRFEIATVLLLTLLAASLPGVARARRIALAAAAFLAAVPGVLVADREGIPLLAGAAMLVLNELLIGSRGPARALAPLIAFAFLAAAIPATADATGLALALGDKLIHSQPGQSVAAPALSAIEFIDCAEDDRFFCFVNDNGAPFVRFTNEGLDLLRAWSGPTDSVLGMGLSNPFSFALRRPPSRGGAAGISSAYISGLAMPPKQFLVGEADLLVLPNFPATGQDTLETVLRRYPELLAVDYAAIASSEHWTLYRRYR